jgi:hypothetical protein
MAHSLKFCKRKLRICAQNHARSWGHDVNESTMSCHQGAHIWCAQRHNNYPFSYNNPLNKCFWWINGQKSLGRYLYLMITFSWCIFHKHKLSNITRYMFLKGNSGGNMKRRWEKIYGSPVKRLPWSRWQLMTGWKVLRGRIASPHTAFLWALRGQGEK